MRALFFAFFLAAGLMGRFPAKALEIPPQQRESAALPAGGRFFCDFRLIKSGEAGSDYFDRIFSISKKGKDLIGKFPLQTDPPFKMRKRGNVVFGLFESADSKKLQEEHILYRYESHSGRLVKSFVRYGSRQDYESAMRAREGNPHLIPFSAEAAQLAPPAPPGMVSYGFDKSVWICRRVSLIKFMTHGLGEAFMQILGI